MEHVSTSCCSKKLTEIRKCSDECRGLAPTQPNCWIMSEKTLDTCTVWVKIQGALVIHGDEDTLLNSIKPATPLQRVLIDCFVLNLSQCVFLTAVGNMELNSQQSDLTNCEFLIKINARINASSHLFLKNVWKSLSNPSFTFFFNLKMVSKI